LRDIEQSSDNLQRLPSLQPSIQIEPGTEVGTSDLVLTLERKRPLRLGFSINDAGQKTHGVLQSQTTLSWDNPLGLGDLLYYNYGRNLGRKDPGPRGSHSHTVHYSLPWGYWLLSATASQSRNRQTEFGPFQSYLYRGQSQQHEVSLARVLHRSGQSKTTATISHVERESRNFIDDLEVFVQRRSARGWDLGLQHIHYLKAGTVVASLGAKHMRETLGAAESAQPQQHISGRLHTAGLSWSMPWQIANHPWQYAAQWSGQWAQSPLAAQERFCLGGRSTVRGFNGRQNWCGDHGQLIRQEISSSISNPPWVGQQLQGYAALDHGRAYDSGQSKDTLQGITLGVRGLDTLPKGGTVQWDVFVAKSTRQPTGITQTKPVSGFTFRAQF
jgi:hemolysin activation/secretion protein